MPVVGSVHLSVGGAAHAAATAQITNHNLRSRIIEPHSSHASGSHGAVG